MRRRKKKAEEQAYKNAKDAILGWKNVSAFRGAVCVNLMHYFSFKVCCLELLYKLIKWFISFFRWPFCELVKEKLWQYRRYSFLCWWDAVRGDFPWISYTCSSFPSTPCSAWISLLATSPYPFCCWNFLILFLFDGPSCSIFPSWPVYTTLVWLPGTGFTDYRGVKLKFTHCFSLKVSKLGGKLVFSIFFPKSPTFYPPEYVMNFYISQVKLEKL